VRITFIISSLASGGAERVMSMISNYWVDKDRQVTIITLSDKGNGPFYELDKRINYFYLGRPVGSETFFIKWPIRIAKIGKLKVAIKKSNPDIIISFIDRTNILTLFSTRGLKVPVVVAERSDPAKHPISRFENFLRQLIYPFADKIIVQTRGAADFFSGPLKKKLVIIPNPVSKPENFAGNEGSLLPRPHIITIGRFSKEKRFDMLIRIFSNIAREYLEWNLVIIGDGPERPFLQRLCRNLNLEKRVIFLGRQKNVYQFLRNADLFVLCSRYEGFPNALCEAMACGLPVISTDCPSGPRAVIQNGVDGLLADNMDENDLLEKIKHLIDSSDVRKRLGTAARAIIDRFNMEKIMGMWESVVKDLTYKA